MKTILVLLAAAVAAAAATHVHDTLLLNDGATPMKGTIVLYGPTGGAAQATNRTITIGSGGVVDFDVVGCSACGYRAEYRLTNDAGTRTASWTEPWIVPDVVSTLTVRQLWGGSSAPYYLISPHQISGEGLAANQMWIWNGTAWVKAAPLLADTITATLGDLPYWNGTAWVRVAGNTSALRRFLCQTGNGTISGAPGWCGIGSTDLPVATTSAPGAVTTTTSTTQVVSTDDPRNSDARTPTAHASTHLGNGSDAIGAASTTVRGTVTTTTSTAVVVSTDDARNSDARTPTAHASTHLGNGSDAIGAASTTVRGTVTTTTSSPVAVSTDDTRNSDARTPTAHASTHGSGGTDPVTVAESQVTSLAADLAARDVVTPTSSLPAAGAATVGRVYRWTGATTANACPAAGAAGSGGSAVAHCLTHDGANWRPVFVGGTDGTLPIGTTCPGGAPSGSACIVGKYYGDGSQLTGVAGHSIAIPVAGNPIGTGTANVGIPSAPVQFACTVNKVTVSANASGSLTVDVWKRNNALPSGSNKISASAPAALSSAQFSVDSALTGWTTAVSTNDVFWASVATADGVLTSAAVVISCQ